MLKPWIRDFISAGRVSPSNAIRYETKPEMTAFGEPSLASPRKKEPLTRRSHGCPAQNTSRATGIRAEDVFTRCEDINFA